MIVLQGTVDLILMCVSFTQRFHCIGTVDLIPMCFSFHYIIVHSFPFDVQ